MELKVKFEIQNLYGGDGFTRPEERREVVYEVKKSKEVEKYDNLSLDEKAEKNIKIRIENVNTFKQDEEGNNTQRLGGSHGKLWGSMKAVGLFLVDCKNQTLLTKGVKSLSGVKRMMGSLNITPIYPTLKYDKEKIWIDVIPQILNTMGNSMVKMEYDVIDKAECELTLIYPDMYHAVILEMLKSQEMIPTLNKRRSTIKVLNREIFGDKK